MQEQALVKQFWNVGNVVFKAFKWSPVVLNDEILVVLVPRWLIVKDVPVQLWAFIPRLLALAGNVLLEEETRST